MTRNVKRAAGVAMLALLICVTTGTSVLAAGWSGALIVLGICVLVLVWVYAALCLILD